MRQTDGQTERERRTDRERETDWRTDRERETVRDSERHTAVEFIRQVITLSESITDVIDTDTLSTVTTVLTARWTSRLTRYIYRHTQTHTCRQTGLSLIISCVLYTLTDRHLGSTVSHGCLSICPVFCLCSINYVSIRFLINCHCHVERSQFFSSHLLCSPSTVAVTAVCQVTVPLICNCFFFLSTAALKSWCKERDSSLQPSVSWSTNDDDMRVFYTRWEHHRRPQTCDTYHLLAKKSRRTTKTSHIHLVNSC